jgi:hypothetical protein
MTLRTHALQGLKRRLTARDVPVDWDDTWGYLLEVHLGERYRLWISDEGDHGTQFMTVLYDNAVEEDEGTIISYGDLADVVFAVTALRSLLVTDWLARIQRADAEAQEGLTTIDQGVDRHHE